MNIFFVIYIIKKIKSRENSVSSLCSNMSSVSVNYDGNEVDLDEAVDFIFKELQHHINGMHTQIRETCQWDLRGESYEEVKVYFDTMATHIKEGNGLFKDLLKVISQIMPPKPKIPKTIKE